MSLSDTIHSTSDRSAHTGRADSRSVLGRIPTDIWLALVILVMFGLLQNHFWTSGGDSDVYLDMARNLALGKGYQFNHQPVSQVTPLWPIVLGAAMKISPAFLFLKMVPMLSMAGGLLIWHRILLRVTTPRIAARAILISAMLAPLESLIYRFYTEGFFTLVASATVLVAMQVNERRPLRWRLPLLLILCAASICTRWAGVLWWPVIAGALLNGRSLFPWPFSVRASASRGSREESNRSEEAKVGLIQTADVASKARQVADAEVGASPLQNSRAENPGPVRAGFDGRLWLICGATLFVTLATFFLLRVALRVTPDQIDPRYDKALAVHYDFLNKEPTLRDFADRVLSAWQWIGDLIWQPAVIAGKLAKRGVCLAASVLLLVVLCYVPHLLKRRQWLFLSLLAYFAVLCADWPRPVARYIVPAAPLMLVLLYHSCRWAADLVPAASKWMRLAVTWGVISVIVCNGAFAAVEIYVARAHNYYATFEAGLNESFIDDIVYARDHGVGDAEIAINPLNVSLKNSGQFRNRYMRAAVVISDRGIRMIPEQLAGVRDEDGAVTPLDPIGEPIRNWLTKERVRYYMYRPPASTVWHFDVRGKHLPGAPPAGDADAMDWQLYEVTHDGLHRIHPPRIHNWPTSIPGME